MSQYLLALDAGTGSVRAVLFDSSLNQIAIAQSEWSHHGESGVEGAMNFDWVTGWEMASACILDAIKQAGINPEHIVAVSASSMREGIVVYDEAGRELWAVANVDSRAGDEVATLNAQHPNLEREQYLVSGQTFALGAMPRLLWLAHHRPELYAKAHTFTMISDWLLYKLSGVLVVEPSNAGTAGGFSLESRDWVASQFEACGLKSMQVRVVESGTVIGEVGANDFGLNPSCKVVAGGGDVQIGTAGLGANALGDFVVLGGSFWQQVVNIPATATLSPDMKLRVNPHVVRGMSQAEGITFFTGLVMRWFRNTLGGGKSYAELEKLASAVPVGSYGIMPIFSDAMNYGKWIHAAPSFVGLGLDEERYNIASMFRALEENACIVSAINLENIEAFSGVTPKRIIFASGASQGSLWSQILADVTGLEVVVPVVKEATALGVAMAAGIGAGLWGSFEEAGARFVKFERTYTPDMANHAVYQGIKARWAKIYAKQMELVHEGLTEPMWKAPGL